MFLDSFKGFDEGHLAVATFRHPLRAEVASRQQVPAVVASIVELRVASTVAPFVGGAGYLCHS
jgi:hypothetical protein